MRRLLAASLLAISPALAAPQAPSSVAFPTAEGPGRFATGARHGDIVCQEAGGTCTLGVCSATGLPCSLVIKVNSLDDGLNELWCQPGSDNGGSAPYYDTGVTDCSATCEDGELCAACDSGGGDPEPNDRCVQGALGSLPRALQTNIPRYILLATGGGRIHLEDDFYVDGHLTTDLTLWGHVDARPVQVTGGPLTFGFEQYYYGSATKQCRGRDPNLRSDTCSSDANCTEYGDCDGIQDAGELTADAGCCVQGPWQVVTAPDNVIVRYMQFRMGIEDVPLSNYHNYSAMTFGCSFVKDEICYSICDHCEAWWAGDGLFKTIQNTHNTVQYSIAAEGFRVTDPDKSQVCWERNSYGNPTSAENPMACSGHSACSAYGSCTIAACADKTTRCEVDGGPGTCNAQDECVGGVYDGEDCEPYTSEVACAGCCVDMGQSEAVAKDGVNFYEGHGGQGFPNHCYYDLDGDDVLDAGALKQVLSYRNLVAHVGYRIPRYGGGGDSAGWINNVVYGNSAEATSGSWRMYQDWDAVCGLDFHVNMANNFYAFNEASRWFPYNSTIGGLYDDWVYNVGNAAMDRMPQGWDHDPATKETFLRDDWRGGSYISNSLAGFRITNLTTGAYGTVTANSKSAKTITFAGGLTGGSRQTFIGDAGGNGDRYELSYCMDYAGYVCPDQWADVMWYSRTHRPTVLQAAAPNACETAGKKCNPATLKCCEIANPSACDAGTCFPDCVAGGGTIDTEAPIYSNEYVNKIGKWSCVGGLYDGWPVDHRTPLDWSDPLARENIEPSMSSDTSDPPTWPTSVYPAYDAANPASSAWHVVLSQAGARLPRGVLDTDEDGIPDSEEERERVIAEVGAEPNSDFFDSCAFAKAGGTCSGGVCINAGPVVTGRACRPPAEAGYGECGGLSTWNEADDCSNYPVYETGGALPTDTDNDGLPDAWEDARESACVQDSGTCTSGTCVSGGAQNGLPCTPSLDSTVWDSTTDFSGNGYHELEDWANEIADGVVYSPPNPPEPPAEYCGDGTINGLEECDDGPANSDSTPDACRTNCFNAYCGDGITDTGETCDHGAALIGGSWDALEECCYPPDHASECTYLPNATPCDDTLWCKVGETCDAEGTCVTGSDRVCDDGVPCTVDSCDEPTDSCVVIDASSCTTQITYQGSSVSSGLAATVADPTVELSHSTSAGTNRLILGYTVGASDPGDNHQRCEPDGATYAGTQMNQVLVGTVIDQSDYSYSRSLWSLALGDGSPVGAQDFAVTFPSDVTDEDMCERARLAVIVLEYVNQSAPVAATGSSQVVNESSETSSLTVTGTTVEQMLVDFHSANRTLGFAPGGAQTEREDDGQSGYPSIQISTSAVGGPSATATWTYGSPYTFAVHVGASLVPDVPPAVILDPTFATGLQMTGGKTP